VTYVCVVLKRIGPRIILLFMEMSENIIFYKNQV